MHPSPKNTIRLTGSPKARMPTNDATTGSRLARMLALPLSTLARPFVHSRSGSTVEMGTAVTIWVSTGKQQVSVPFVTNSTLAEAKSILEAAGFQVSVNGPQDDDATVVSMSPNGGSQADSGSTITLTTKKSSSDTNNTDTNNNGNTNNQQGN